MVLQNDWIENQSDLKEYKDRYAYLYGLIIATFVLLFCRLWYLQILKGSELRRFSEQNQFKEMKIEAPRGMIFDRSGKPLVDNVPAFSAVLTPQYMKSLDDVAQEVSRILDIDKEELKEKIQFSRRQNGAYKPLRVKDSLTRDEVFKIERMKINFPGLDVEMRGVRIYILGSNGAQLLGYTSEVGPDELPILNAKKLGIAKLKAGDMIGKSGIEKQWDQEIRGEDGSQALVVDARGREVGSDDKTQILSGYSETTDPIPGQSLTLTLDADLQKLAYESMTKDKRVGSVLAMDPRTGEILVMVNTPSFDPNEFADGITPEAWAKMVNNPLRPMRNRAIQDFFPPASTFKAIVAIAALEEKVITPETTYFCPGSFKYGRRLYHCAVQHGHGNVNVVTALEQSCDVFFFHLALTLGVDKIAKYARKLGFGSKTGILLDGERAGLIPDSDWKRKTLGEEWQPGENLSIAIGQGFVAATPLQVLTAYSAIAMEGLLMKPFIVSHQDDLGGALTHIFKPELRRNLQTRDSKDPEAVSISSETFAVVKKGLNLVFNGDHGTARSFKIPGLNMSGKTGTAQVIQFAANNIYGNCESRNFNLRHNAWMVSFAPQDNPRFAVLVHAEHGCHPTVAGPIVKELMQAYFEKYEPALLRPK